MQHDEWYKSPPKRGSWSKVWNCRVRMIDIDIYNWRIPSKPVLAQRHAAPPSVHSFALSMKPSSSPRTFPRTSVREYGWFWFFFFGFSFWPVVVVVVIGYGFPKSVSRDLSALACLRLRLRLLPSPPHNPSRSGTTLPSLSAGQSSVPLGPLGLELPVVVVAPVGAGHVVSIPESAAHGDTDTCALVDFFHVR